MVAGDVKPPEMKIESQGQKTDEPGTIPRRIGEERTQVLNEFVVGYPEMVVQNERDMEGVGIDDDASQQNE